MRYILYGSFTDSLDKYYGLGEFSSMRPQKSFEQPMSLCWGQSGCKDRLLLSYKSSNLTFAHSDSQGPLDLRIARDGTDHPVLERSMAPGLGRSAGESFVWNLRIWHLWFDFPRSMSDFNILSVSPHFAGILAGRSPRLYHRTLQLIKSFTGSNTLLMVLCKVATFSNFYIYTYITKVPKLQTYARRGSHVQRDHLGCFPKNRLTKFSFSVVVLRLHDFDSTGV